MRRTVPAILIAMLTACAGAAAQPLPAGPVRVIVGYPRGSGADITARVIGVKFYEATGRQFDIDNRPGAGSNLAAAVAAGSPADGRTLFVGSVTNVINATLYPKLSFDFTRDFAPVALATAEPHLLVAHVSMPARSVKELLALAKSRPGEVRFASAGIGTVTHLAGELFRTLAGVGITHVPGKDGSQALADLAAGATDLMFPPASDALPQVQGGRLRALAVTTASRLASLPQLPTVAGSGLPGYEAATWFGFLAPAQTPPAMVARLHVEIVNALGQPDARSQFELQDFEIIGGNPARFADFIRAETAKWAKVIRLSGAKAD